MRFYSIASGSSGNCIYIGSDCTHVLVDVGISGKRIIEGINNASIDTKDIDGILITHEHSDHVKSVGMLTRKYGIPVYATQGTINAIRNMPTLGNVDDQLLNVIRPDEKFTIKDMEIRAVKTSHDAADSVAYRVKCDDKKAGVVTDLGVFNDYTVDCFAGCDVILAETNHDVKMLECGPYPYQLKKRILGDRGHLSNENGGRLISRLLHDNMKHVFLGHLSFENNMPELAYETVRLEIEASDTPYHGNDFEITVAKRDFPSTLIEF